MFGLIFDALDAVIGGAVRATETVADFTIEATLGTAGRLIDTTFGVAETTIGVTLAVLEQTVDVGVKYGLPLVAAAGQSYITGLGLGAAAQIPGIVGDAVRIYKGISDALEPLDFCKTYADLVRDYDR